MPFSTSIAFYDIFAQARTEIKISRPLSLGFLAFIFLGFGISFFSFSYLFAAAVTRHASTPRIPEKASSRQAIPTTE